MSESEVNCNQDMIICGKGIMSEIRRQFDLIDHFFILTGECPLKTENIGGYLQLTERSGKKYLGKNASDITRQIMIEYNIFTKNKTFEVPNG